MTCSGLEQCISQLFLQSFGDTLLFGLGFFLAFNIFMFVIRVPGVVAIMADALILILVFGPTVMSGALGYGMGIYFVGLILAGIIVYIGLKNTVLRD